MMEEYIAIPAGNGVRIENRDTTQDPYRKEEVLHYPETIRPGSLSHGVLD
jgi:hypothetical protein